MAVAFASQQSNSGFSSSLSVTKPAGLQVGDMMVAFAYINGESGSDISGWNLLRQQSSGSNVFKCWYKVADSADVAATSFSVTNNSGVNMYASISRITGSSTTIAPVSSSGGNTNVSSLSFSGLTPGGTDTLLMLATGWNDAVSRTVGSYAIATSNPTWTEQLDGFNGGIALGLAFATASRPQSTPTGNASMSWSGAGSVDLAFGIIVSIQEYVAPPTNGNFFMAVSL